MASAWTIRSRRNATGIRRPSSLSSLPDLSDNLEISSRPGSGVGWLSAFPSDLDFRSQNRDDDARVYCSQSNISVSFLGSRIRRQYRSTFLLADDQMVGVTRWETFHPEDSKADVRVSRQLKLLYFTSLGVLVLLLFLGKSLSSRTTK